MVRLLLRESEKVIAKIEVEFDQELELQFPGTAEQKKFEIANKHQAFKNNLFTRRKKKWSKFNERGKKENIKNKTSNEQSKKSSQQINKTDGLSTPFLQNQSSLFIDNDNITISNRRDNANITINEMLNSANKSWITDNRISRRRKKTFAQEVIEGNKKIGNGSTGSEDLENVDIFVKSVSKCKNKEGSKERKVTDLSDIYNNLIQGEQSNFSRSPNSPPLVFTDTSSSNNATSSDVRSGIVSEDLCLNTQDEEFLNILEELQCPRDDRGRNSFCLTTEK